MGKLAESVGASTADPAVKLESRRQGKEESMWTFGLGLKRLAVEAFPGVSFSEPWLITKINSSSSEVCTTLSYLPT